MESSGDPYYDRAVKEIDPPPRYPLEESLLYPNGGKFSPSVLAN